jgi:hypothetical protein
MVFPTAIFLNHKKGRKGILGAEYRKVANAPVAMNIIPPLSFHVYTKTAAEETRNNMIRMDLYFAFQR